MPYTHITTNEREMISLMCAQGITQAEIARRLRRSRSTISREIQRNSGKIGYTLLKAQHLAEKRRAASKSCYCMTDPHVLQYVTEKLHAYWSPEQIAHTYKNIRTSSSSHVSHQTIYAWIKADKENGGSWYTYLRQARRVRRKRYGSGSSNTGHLTNVKAITDRPAIVDRRVRVGDWESDTIHGAQGTGYIATHVCRVSKYVVLAKMINKEAHTFNRQSLRAFNRHGSLPRHTFTVDRGKEFAGHKQWEQACSCEVYFSEPYQAWQRGTNENTNGLLRQFFPKGADFRKISHAYIKKVELLLNTRPRKTLEYQTPCDVMAKIATVALQT